jgi:predicted dehydrogenase
MEGKLSWGIIGAGRIAEVFAQGMASCDSGALGAVADIDAGRAEESAGRFEAAAHYADGHELLEDTRAEAVCIATPHPFHAESAINAAEAGKHVLVANLEA